MAGTPADEGPHRGGDQRDEQQGASLDPVDQFVAAAGERQGDRTDAEETAIRVARDHRAVLGDVDSATPSPAVSMSHVARTLERKF